MHKHFVRSIAAVGTALVIWGTNANATTYMKFVINGDSSATEMTQGDTLGFTCDCGVGDTVLFDYYLDVNENHIIDTNDVFLAPFSIIDGDTVPYHGVWDSSPVPDGILYCSGRSDGSAPATYCVKATDESATSDEDYLIVNPLPSPLSSVSGTVTVEGVTPPNPILKYIMLGAMSSTESWSALPDSMGDYTINFGSSGVTFSIGWWSEIPGYTGEGDTTLIVTGDITGIDFVFTQVSAEESQITNKPFLTLTPNLASNKVTIRYMLANNENVSLKLYDITGQAVQTLTNEYQTSGLHTTELTTNSLASGIYFVTLQAGSYKGTQKLILTK